MYIYLSGLTKNVLIAPPMRLIYVGSPKTKCHTGPPFAHVRDSALFSPISPSSGCNAKATFGGRDYIKGKYLLLGKYSLVVVD